MTARRGDPTDFRITRRTTKSFAISARRYDPVTGADIGPLNLTGATVRFTAKRRYQDDDASAVITKTVGAGITLDDAANGLATLKLVDADTAPADSGKITDLVYSLEVTQTGETVEIAYGTLTVDPKARQS
jgi:hypothetical protein